MAVFLFAFIASLVAATAFTPLARAVAIRIGAVSAPGGRHVHARSIPRLGGLALACAWCLALGGLLLLHPTAKSDIGTEVGRLAAVIGGGLFLCLVGALDDLRGVRAGHKLLAQLVVAWAAFAAGFRIDAVHLPVVGVLPMGDFALPVTILWIVGITNAVNLIDGLDGLAAGVAFFAGFTNFVVAYVSGSLFVALLMAGLMGALVGFLFFNFNPARIFMGDSGSYFVGFVLATTALAGSLQQKASTAVSLLVPVIALGLPIFDTLFSMVRRFLERRPIFSPDRGHVHHRLLELGLTHRRAVILLYGVSIVLAAGAIAVSLGRSWEVGVALFSVSVVFVALVRFLGYFEYLHGRRRQGSRLYEPHTQQLRLTVPELVLRLARASDEEAVFEILEATTHVCALSSVMLTEIGETGAVGNVIEKWGASNPAEPERMTARADFPLGRDDRARAVLTFSWPSDTEEPEPRTAILLQLVADAVGLALERAGSRLAPVRQTLPAVETANVPLPSSA